MGLSGMGDKTQQTMAQVKYHQPSVGINMMPNQAIQWGGGQALMGQQQARPDPMMMLQQLSQYQPRNAAEHQQIMGMRNALIQQLYQTGGR